ncbi:MAG TPA: hypothetical protein VHN74_05110 [Candidatus Angelobacter sp.]|nr:hypothetical protein [Candidatus Angelobacter sp.]
MGQGSARELQDLTAVNAFYTGLLEKSLGHAVPLPSEVRDAQNADELKNWLDLLDLALTPSIIRDALKGSAFDTAYALLRYFNGKGSPRSGDRDKTDCVITHLFRNPPADAEGPPSWQRPEIDSSYFFVTQAALAFQGHLYKSLGDVEFTNMPQDHISLLQEFEYLYQELEEFRHFDQVMDSNIVQRVRELKQSLGNSFYHPNALAQIAVWNDVFGRKFDELFHDAAKQIKTFAENVQKEGGSMLSRLEGDITVKQLAEVETGQLLAEDYQNAQDDFRRVSKYKKVVDSKRPGRTAGPAPSYTPPANAVPPRPVPTSAASAEPANTSGAQPASPPSRPPAVAPAQIKAEVLAVPPSQAVNNAVQEGKLFSAKESIKEHVRTTEATLAPIVQIKNTRITLSAAEVEAFKADYQGEKSFRADYANIMMSIVAYLSRMIVEVDEYNQKATSAYLWKPHADALAYLLTTLERLSMEAESIMAVARARGLQEKAAGLKASLDKVRDYGKTVSQTLQAQSAQPQAGN